MFKESARIASVAKITPIVDGSGVKDTLERYLVHFLTERYGFDFLGKKVLVVSAVDRFGMAESFEEAGARLICGDLLFAIGLPIPLRKLKTLGNLVDLAAPLLTRMPVGWLYPTGKKQTTRAPRYTRFFLETDIIAGDFHYIRRYMPARLDGKVVITSSVAKHDMEMLIEAGVKMVVTTSPDMGCRAFGANVLEAILTAIGRPCTLQDFKEIGIEPQVRKFEHC